MRTHRFLQLGTLALLLALVPALRAVPITPGSDDEVIDVLPAPAASRVEARRLRQQLAQQPRDAAAALALARPAAAEPGRRWRRRQ